MNRGFLVWCDNCDYEAVLDSYGLAHSAQEMHEGLGAPHRCFITSEEEVIESYFIRNARAKGGTA